MLTLMKYEFRKTWFPKVVLLVITALVEVLFLIGIGIKSDNTMGYGILGLVLVSLFGLLFIGIESMLTLHRDLNTKQSYMLFLTPNSCYKILGAKVLEGSLSLVLAGAFFAILASIDIRLLFQRFGQTESIVSFLQSSLDTLHADIELTPKTLLYTLFTFIAEWIRTIVFAYLAIIISTTFLAGKKLSLLLSFVLFIVMEIVCNRLLALLPAPESQDLAFVVSIAASLVLAAVFYFITARIMDRRLSV